ncbi:MAG TPA: type II toxin-antitoxin system YafQ family toxin [Candidatus Kapabacteria bacterium]|nr:type II toxin-antitoxin system YafQ family toxin [Candidatus Kapabacteria bacterium]
MLRPIITRKFDRDSKRMVRRGKSPAKLKEVVSLLLDEKQLEPKYQDHKLSGDYEGSRECHIQPDWLMIYTIDPPILRLERTGSHSDLFK